MPNPPVCPHVYNAQPPSSHCALGAAPQSTDSLSFIQTHVLLTQWHIMMCSASDSWERQGHHPGLPQHATACTWPPACEIQHIMGYYMGYYKDIMSLLSTSCPCAAVMMTLCLMAAMMQPAVCQPVPCCPGSAMLLLHAAWCHVHVVHV